MTREEAIDRIRKSSMGRSYPNPKEFARDWIELWEAVGMIKFDESEDERLMNLANRYSKDIFYYENDSLLETITQMSHAISFLLKKAENK